MNDGFGNDVFSFDFSQDGVTALSIPLIVHEDKCYLALSLNDVRNYFSISFPPGEYVGESMFLIKNLNNYYIDEDVLKPLNKL